MTMSRTSPQRRIPSCNEAASCDQPALATIEGDHLITVVGGRMAPRQNADPVIGQGMQQLSQAVQSIGQNMAAAKQKSSSDLMQMMQQMAQQRQGGGGGDGPGGGAAAAAAGAGPAAGGHHGRH
jgi:hypothetical protein